MNDIPDIPNGPGCACVHNDAHECARIRDRIQGFPVDDDQHRRACECECHAKDLDELESLTAERDGLKDKVVDLKFQVSKLEESRTVLWDLLKDHNQHHEQELNVFFSQDGKPIEVETDLGEAYSESKLAERTRDVLFGAAPTTLLQDLENLQSQLAKSVGDKQSKCIQFTCAVILAAVTELKIHQPLWWSASKC